VRRAACWAVALLLCLCGVVPALAHKPSDSYLRLQVDEGSITGRWDIALRDLDFAIGLDANGDGDITWGEVRERHADIAAYALARLELQADGVGCSVQGGPQQIDRHTDGAYSVLPLRGTCATTPRTLGLNYRLFADIDPQHRGLLQLQSHGATRSAVLGPHAPTQQFELQRPSLLEQFLDYVREGVWHIWIGFDHILFLLSLLLPAVLVWTVDTPKSAAVRRPPPRGRAQEPGTPPRLSGGQWRAADGVWPVFIDVLKIVTAFTVAHSITLSMATMGVVELPSRAVEALIAASVVLAALNNLWPLVQGRRWMVAFGFGLIHGFGFANVLADLGLPRDTLLLALVGFNVGVELGQLAIVALFLPLAFLLRRTRLYRQGVFVGGSALIAAVALLWLGERMFNFKVLPF
jgi:HupE / UreJ protein